MLKAEQILEDVFGYHEFRDNQREIISDLLEGRDVIAIMPTGSGKSLCYQIPALIFEGITIVVSPLISLMKDQVMQLHQNGVEAIYLNSSLPDEEYIKYLDLIRRNQVKLLYIAPETLTKERMISLLKNSHISLLAIDEAHCISEWGHDFRPEYNELYKVKEVLKGIVTIALTATATIRVRADIRQNLRLESAKMYLASFNRENLRLNILPKNEPETQILEILERFPEQSGLIYCFSRKQVDNLSAFLKEKGFSTLPYHAGLTYKERKENQEAYSKDEVQIIIATIAFGMGINKPNIRFVIHHDLPKNIESYYQQIGRAGRDGEEAYCYLLFNYGDITKIKMLLVDKPEKEVQISLSLLESMVKFCESEECRRKPLLNYFGEDYQQDFCGKCDNCLHKNIPKENLTIAAQKFLSCVKRTGEMFGSVHTILVLRGAKNQRISELGHDKLSVYGIGQEFSRKQWNHLFRQFLRRDIVRTDDYGSIKITVKGWEVLRNQRIFEGTLIDEKTAVVRQDNTDYDGILFEQLRRLRARLATEENVPSFMIFTDRTLKEIASFYPQSLESLKKINGMSSKKIAKYGSQILTATRSYCLKNNHREKDFIQKVSSVSDSVQDRQNTEKVKKRNQLIAEHFEAGTDFSAIASLYNIKESTVISNLEEFLTEGHLLNREIDISGKISSQEFAEVVKVIDNMGSDRLKPIFEHFNGKYNYDLLRLIRIKYSIKKQTEHQ